MRHGHVDYFTPGLVDFAQVPLTDIGQEQARIAGEALSQVRFDGFYASGLPRTQQTCQLVQSANQHINGSEEISVAQGFAELKGGNYRTDSRVELAARLAYAFDSAALPEADFLPGGEKFIDALARIRQAIHDLCFNHPWQQALLVAHEGVNRIILGIASGADLNGIGHFEQDLGCINVLDFDIVPTGEDQAGAKIERIIIKAMNLTPYDSVKSGLPRTSLEHLFDIDFGGARPPSSTSKQS